tara:strand:+ start:1057 stop:3129 length:2073 start_codon:yes stop_codon:yes gene_type:complete
MARASVELIVEAAKAVNPLRQVERQARRVENQLEKTRKSTKRVEAAFILFGRKGANAIRDLEKNTARLGKRMSGLRGAAVKAAVAFVAFKSGQAAIGRIESVRRLQRLGSAYGEVAQLQDAATRASKTFGLSQTEANKQFAQIFARLRPVGVSLKDIESTFVGFNTVARLSGASSVEASNAFTQLAQALGSGVLRGDEFNSISEQVPGILTAISKETGIAQGNLRKYAAEGKITSDIVMNALKRIEKEGAGDLEDAMNGPAQAFVNFKNVADNALVALGEKSIPEVVRLIDHMSDAIEGLMPVIKSVGGFAAEVLGGIADTIDRIRDPSKAQKLMQDHLAEGRRKAALKRPGVQNVPVNTEEQARFNAMFAAVIAPSVSSESATQPPPANKIQPTGGLTSADKISDAERLTEATKTEIENLKQQATLATGLTQQEKDMLQLKIDIQKVEANRALVGDDLTKAHKERLIATFAQKNIEQALNDDRDRAVQRLEDAADAKAKADAEEAARVQELNGFYQSIADTIQAGIVGAIQGAIDGSKSLKESLSGLLKQVGGLFLNRAIGSVMPTFGAEGLYVNSPTNAVIGEGGEPEYVIPESKMRESMARYSRGSRGAGVIPDNEGATAANAAGGGSGGSVDVRFNVERINSVDYVTASEFQAGIAQAAQQGAREGERRALGSMQNSPAVRRRVRI